MNKKLAALLLLPCVMFALSACSSKGDSSSDSALFAEFTATDTDGNEQNQDIFSTSDVTMVNIWGTFCAPCIDEMPDLAKLNEEYSDRNFKVVGIVADVAVTEQNPAPEELADALEIIELTGANYTHLLASQSLYDIKLKDVTGVPETVFVDKTGAVIGESYLGSKPHDDWAKIIEEKLELVK